MIGKTRQNFDAAAGPPRGILPSGQLQPGVYEHSRRVPHPDLQPWIVHYWLISWDLEPGVRQTVETLPHPNVQLVFSNDDAWIHGVHTSKFTRVLEGRQQVFGVKFRAGGFRPFLGRPVGLLRGKTIPAREVLPRIDELAPLATGELSEQEKIDRANAYFLHGPLPDRDETLDLVASLAEEAARNPALRTVRDLAELAGMSERSLQRLFREYVGVTPKWMIVRYRMHELIERLNSGQPVDWASAAADLGYFDQSHLIRDFRRFTGYAPETYRRSTARR